MIGSEFIEYFIKTTSLDYPGIYRMINSKREVLYIGKAKNLKNRLKSYINPDQSSQRICAMVSQISHIEILTTKSEHEALILEASLIKSLKPKYNILLKDDKSHPYILITKNHDFPQLTKFRGTKDVSNGTFYGPFASSHDVDYLLNILHQAFKIRNCTDSYFNSRTRPCLQYQIKRCSAPCVGKISAKEYQQEIKQAKLFMNGQNKDIQKQLVAKMEIYSQKLEFEKAAQLRDQIQILNKMQQKNTNFQNLKSTDVITVIQNFDIASIFVFFYRNGFSFGHKEFYPEISEDITISEIMSQFLMLYYKDRQDIPEEIIVNTAPEHKDTIEQIIGSKILTPNTGWVKEIMNFANDNANRALIEKLKHKADNTNILAKISNLLGTKSLKLVEVYDNSHIFGSHAIGAMIAAGESGFLKNNYRKFNIKSNDKGDDLAMMAEMLDRRIAKLIADSPHYIESIWPDLLIIDGGKNQLNIAKQVLQKYELADQIKVISIAKGEFRNKGNETIYTDDGEVINLENSDDRMKYLQILRDEVHRFAITTYRKKHIKSMTRSELISIPGIGSKKCNILFNYFGSIENIKNASIAELTKVEMIDKKTAEKIYNYFNGDLA